MKNKQSTPSFKLPKDHIYKPLSSSNFNSDELNDLIKEGSNIGEGSSFAKKYGNYNNNEIPSPHRLKLDNKPHKDTPEFHNNSKSEDLSLNGSESIQRQSSEILKSNFLLEEEKLAPINERDENASSEGNDKLSVIRDVSHLAQRGHGASHEHEINVSENAEADCDEGCAFARRVSNPLSSDQLNNRHQSIMINQVKNISRIDFNQQTKKLTIDKGKPVYNQLPDFRKVGDNKRWLIPIAENVRNQNFAEIEEHKRSNQAALFELVQRIQMQVDQITIQKQNFEDNFRDEEEKIFKEELRQRAEQERLEILSQHKSKKVGLNIHQPRSYIDLRLGDQSRLDMKRVIKEGKQQLKLGCASQASVAGFEHKKSLAQSENSSQSFYNQIQNLNSQSNEGKNSNKNLNSNKDSQQQDSKGFVMSIEKLLQQEGELRLSDSALVNLCDKKIEQLNSEIQNFRGFKKNQEQKSLKLSKKQSLQGMIVNESAHSSQKQNANINSSQYSLKMGHSISVMSCHNSEFTLSSNESSLFKQVREREVQVIEEENGLNSHKQSSDKESQFKLLENRIKELESSVKSLSQIRQKQKIKVISKKDITQAVNVGTNKLLKKQNSLSKIHSDEYFLNSSGLAMEQMSDSEPDQLEIQRLENEVTIRLEDIKRIVQQGGNMCHQAFASFGERDNLVSQESDASKKSNDLSKGSFKMRSPKEDRRISQQSKRSGYQRPRSNSIGGSSQFLHNFVLERESASLKDFSLKENNPGIMKNKNSQNEVASPDKNLPETKLKQEGVDFSKAYQKAIKDSQINHSRILRHIEEKLTQLMISYNSGIIIQMSLVEKLALKEKIDKVLEIREQIKHLLTRKHSKIMQIVHSNLSEGDKQSDTDKSQSAKFSRLKKTTQSASKSSSNNHQTLRNVYKERYERRQKSNQLKLNSQRNISDFEKGSSNKYSIFEIDYDFYFQHNQGMFVVQTQLQHHAYLQMKKQMDFDMKKMMKQIPQFDEMKDELYQEDIYANQKTLCFDIQNIFIRKVNLNDPEEIKNIKNIINDEALIHNYILVNNLPSDPKFQENMMFQDFQIKLGIQKLKVKRDEIISILKNYDSISKSSKSQSKLSNYNKSNSPEITSDCCSIAKNGGICMCEKTLYQVRPYVYDILRAIQPFFEIIALSYMPHYELEQIIDHIESVLNKPIAEMLKRQQKERQELKKAEKDMLLRSKKDASPDSKKMMQREIQMIKKKRLCKQIEPKIFFQFLITDNNYLELDFCSQKVENLFLMTSNRKEGNIFLLTSNHFSIVTAKECGFCVIPITQFVKTENQDIQLNLVENYLLKLRYANDMKSKNNIDFGYLTQQTKSKSKMKVKNSNYSGSDFSSNSSANGGFKLKKNLSFGEKEEMGEIEEEKENSDHDSQVPIGQSIDPSVENFYNNNHNSSKIRVRPVSEQIIESDCSSDLNNIMKSISSGQDENNDNRIIEESNESDEVWVESGEQGGHIQRRN